MKRIALIIGLIFLFCGINDDGGYPIYNEKQTINRPQIFYQEAKELAASKYVPGEFIVKFKPLISERIRKNLDSELKIQHANAIPIRSIRALYKKYNGILIEPIFKSLHRKLRAGKTLDAINTERKAKFLKRTQRVPEGIVEPDLSGFYKIKFPQDTDIIKVIDEYKQDPNVEYAQPNHIYEIMATVPNDPRFGEQWALNNTGQSGGTVDADIDAPEAWDVTTGSSQVTIAIVDTGVDYNHQDLADNIWINEDEIPDNGIDDDGNEYVDDTKGYDFVSVAASEVIAGEDPGPRDNNPPMDFHGHGTHCSGIASAVTNNGVGIAGVSWNSKIMAARAGYEAPDGRGYLEETDSSEALYYATDNGGDIISMSWGGYEQDELTATVIQYAHSNGVVLLTFQ